VVVWWGRELTAGLFAVEHAAIDLAGYLNAGGSLHGPRRYRGEWPVGKSGSVGVGREKTRVGDRLVL